MTATEALEEAVRRWGADRIVDGKKVRTYGDIQDDGTSFGRRYKVGQRTRDTESVTHLEVIGEGGTWEAAFSEADRRKNLEPRR